MRVERGQTVFAICRTVPINSTRPTQYWNALPIDVFQLFAGSCVFIIFNRIFFVERSIKRDVYPCFRLHQRCTRRADEYTYCSLEDASISLASYWPCKCPRGGVEEELGGVALKRKHLTLVGLYFSFIRSLSLPNCMDVMCIVGLQQSVWCA